MKIRIYLKLLGFSVFTGATFNLAAYSVHFFSAPLAAAWRFGIAGVLMLVILALKERMSVQALKKNWLQFLLLGIVGVFGFNIMFFLGMESTSPINGSLIMATNPLVTTILAKFILKDNIIKWQGVGISFSLIGVLLVITHGSWQMIHALSFSKGDILIMIGNICWALYGVLGRRLVKGSKNISTTTYTMVVGAVCLLLVGTGTSNVVSLGNIPLLAWGAILFMAIFTSVLGYLWWNQGIVEIGVSKTSIFFNLVPVVTMIFSVMLGTPVTIIQLIGAILVISGVLIASVLTKTNNSRTLTISKNVNERVRIG